MRLGAQVPDPKGDAAQWIDAHRRLDYGAAIFPLNHEADAATVERFRRAADDAGIVIAEVGAWSNPISPDEAQRRSAIAYCQAQLALADAVGARCCVNIAGSRGTKWDGPHLDNLSDDTFALIVDTVRDIIDAVRPTRTAYALEAMPWIYPDSPESYLRLIEAIDRDRFGVHLDPVNMISSPQRYARNTAFIQECFRILGPRILSAHGKDTLLSTRLTTHIDEVRPGTGALDYATFLHELNRLDPDTPLILEHLPTQEDYALAAAHVRDVAAREGLSFIGPGGRRSQSPRSTP